MKKRLWQGLGVFAALAVVMVVLILTVFRQPTLQWGLVHGLSRLGYQVELTVDRVDQQGLALSDLTLFSPKAKLQLAHLSVDYTWAGLSNRRIDKVTVKGLELDGSLGPEGLKAPILDELLPHGDEAQVAADTDATWSLAEISLGDIGFRLQTPYGLLDGKLAGELKPGQGGDISGRIRAVGNLTQEGLAPSPLDLFVDFGRTDDRLGSLRLHGSLSNFKLPHLDGRHLSISAVVEGADAKMNATLVADQGLITAELALPAADLASLPPKHASGLLKFDLHHLPLTGLAANNRLNGVAEATLNNDRLTIQPRAALTFEDGLADLKGALVAVLTSDNLALTLDQGIPKAFEGAVALDLTQAAGHRGHIQADLSGELNEHLEPSRLTAPLSAQLVLAAHPVGAYKLAPTTLDLDGTLGLADQVASFSGTAKAKSQGLSGPDLVLDPFDATLAPLGDKPVLSIPLGAERASLSARLSLPQLAVQSAGQSAILRLSDLRLSGTVGLADGTPSLQVAVKGGIVDVPDPGFSLTAIEGTIHLPDVTTDIERALIKTPWRLWLAPMALRARLRPSGDNMSISANLDDLRGKPILGIKGLASRDGASGSLTVAMPTIEFGTDRSPGELVPLLAVAKNATGSIQALAKAKWKGSAIHGTAEAKLGDLSLTVGDYGVSGLNGALKLDQLWPPKSAPGQTITVKSLQTGVVPITDIALSFAVANDDGPAVALQDAGLSVVGGRVTLAPMTIKADGTSSNGELRVDGVSATNILALLDRKDIAATGTLEGRIPFHLAPEGIAITDGKLSSTGPGTIRYQPETAPDALQGGGEGVSLMLQALENFHYSALGLTLNRKATGEASVSLHLEGDNPDVLDGYPFAFNINLEGLLDRIARDSLEGWSIPEQIGRGLSRQ